MSTLEIFQTLALILGTSITFTFLLIWFGGLIRPFVYRISYTSKLGDKKVKYVKLIREMRLNTYEEIFTNIRKNHSGTDDIKIERIYVSGYTNNSLSQEMEW